MARCRRRVIFILNAGPDDRTYTDSVTDTGKYADSEITESIKEADIEICNDIIETVGHPYRSFFLTTGAATEITTNGADVPAHIGEKSIVEYWDGSAWKMAELAPNASAVARYRKYASSYGDAATDVEQYYFIEDDSIYFTASKVRVKVASFTSTDAVIQSPRVYERAVSLGGLCGLLKDGGDAQMFDWYYRQYLNSRSIIRNNQLIIPKIEQFKKIQN